MHLPDRAYIVLARESHDKPWEGLSASWHHEQWYDSFTWAMCNLSEHLVIPNRTLFRVLEFTFVDDAPEHVADITPDVDKYWNLAYEEQRHERDTGGGFDVDHDEIAAFIDWRMNKRGAKK